MKRLLRIFRCYFTGGHRFRSYTLIEAAGETAIHIEAGCGDVCQKCGEWVPEERPWAAFETYSEYIRYLKYRLSSAAMFRMKPAAFYESSLFPEAK